MLEFQTTRPVNGHEPFKVEQSPCSKFSLNEDRYATTLASAKGGSCLGSIFYCVSWPLRFVGNILAWAGGFIKNYILCCCRFGPPEERLDWQKTKEAFRQVDQVLRKEDAPNRGKEVRDGLGTLSKAAHERFSQWVLIANAELREGKADRVEQEKWAKENKENVSLSGDYYLKVDNDEVLKVLRLASKNFMDEIERNT